MPHALRAKDVRAQRIKDNELTIQQETDDQIRAIIREYHIIIDVKNRTILHDCADWGKILSTKKLCKHIAKLLLSMDRERAEEILFYPSVIYVFPFVK